MTLVGRRRIITAGAGSALVIAVAVGCSSGSGSKTDIGPPPPHAISAFDTSNMELVAGFATDIFVVHITGVRIVDAPDLSSSLGGAEGERVRPAVREAYAKGLVTRTLKGEGREQIDLYFPADSLLYDSNFGRLSAPVSDGGEYVVAARYSEAREGYLVVPDAGLTAIDTAQNRRANPGGTSAIDRMSEAIDRAIPFGEDGFPLTTAPGRPLPADEPPQMPGNRSGRSSDFPISEAETAEPSYATPTPTTR